jgi:hypothetical protein
LRSSRAAVPRYGQRGYVGGTSGRYAEYAESRVSPVER